ncbi:hypothetical protein BACPLE_01073 [Phocaeicola plebeius DSM 17135]|uniref:Uncharacterized protein n=1 Tax=Phocaeicola plebeius (strain DSM 17135 / JCM 12973 / CCUG 54634 / M2) TaxID=484018 RepID=B5CWI4_PHOPM|nr:hypothetical protein BACPLE_01073 [Phocaeicola plebeius DSM 17135]
MHGHEQTGTEHVEELTGSAGVAVADAPVYGKHHHVKTVGELADVFQLAQETLFFFGRVNVDAEVGAVDQSPMIIVGQETGVPVVQVAGMEDTLAVGLYHPRHTAVVASGGRHAEEFVFPRSTFPQPGVGFFLLRPTVFQDVFRKDVAHVRFPGPPGEDVAVEMVFMEMTGEDVQGLGRLQQTGHHAGRVHPVVEHEDAAVGFEGKAAMEDIGELHRLLE